MKTRKSVIGLMLVVMIIFGLVPNAYGATTASASNNKSGSASGGKVQTTLSPKIYLKGTQIKYKNMPVDQKGILWVPLSESSTYFGYQGVLNKDLGFTVITNGTRTLFFKPNVKAYRLNDHMENLTFAPEAINGVLYVPLDFIGSLFGYSVSYDVKSKIANIKEIVKIQIVKLPASQNLVWEDVQPLFAGIEKEKNEDQTTAADYAKKLKYPVESMLKRKYYYGNWQDALFSMLYYDFNPYTNPDKTYEFDEMTSSEYQFKKIVELLSKESISTIEFTRDKLIFDYGYTTWDAVLYKINYNPYLLVKLSKTNLDDIRSNLSKVAVTTANYILTGKEITKVLYLSFIYDRPYKEMVDAINRYSAGNPFMFEFNIARSNIDFPLRNVRAYDPENVPLYNNAEMSLITKLGLDEKRFSALMNNGAKSFEDAVRFALIKVETKEDISNFYRIQELYGQDFTSINKVRLMTFDWSDVEAVIKSYKK